MCNVVRQPSWLKSKIISIEQFLLALIKPIKQNKTKQNKTKQNKTNYSGTMNNMLSIPFPRSADSWRSLGRRTLPPHTRTSQQDEIPAYYASFAQNLGHIKCVTICQCRGNIHFPKFEGTQSSKLANIRWLILQFASYTSIMTILIHLRVRLLAHAGYIHAQII